MTATEPLDRLDEQARAAARGVRAAHATPQPFRTPRRTSRLAPARIVGAAAVLVLITATAAVLAQQSDDTTTIADVPSSVTPTDPIAPTVVPKGLELAGALPPDEQIEGGVSEVYGRTGSDDPFTGPIVVRGTGGGVDPATPADDEIDIGGVVVRIFPAEMLGGPAGSDYLEWVDLDGEGGSLMSYGTDRETTVQLARAILDEGELPDGWGTVLGAAMTRSSFLSYVDADSNRFLGVSFLAGDTLDLQGIAGMASLGLCGGTRCDEQIELDGYPAWLLQSEMEVTSSDGVDETVEYQDTVMLTFRHSSGWIVTISGTGISAEEAMTVAESLAPTTWRLLEDDVAATRREIGRGFDPDAGGSPPPTIVETTVRG